MSEPSHARRLNAICPYYTMFPLSFPLERLAAAKERDLVLDPFCGRGTTNFAARLLGLESVGIDSNPVACAIARAKLARTTPSAIINACRKILDRPGRDPAPKGAFWRACFSAETLSDLMKLRTSLIENCRSEARIALRALVLGALHGPTTKGEASYLSNQMPRTYAAKPKYAVKFWREKALSPRPVDVLALISRRARYYFDALAPAAPGAVHFADSRAAQAYSRLEPGRAKWVVTSPPYYGLRTYLPDQWLRLWFLGGPPKVQYTNSAQFQHHSPERFVAQLTEVWRNVARACASGARMIVRFGGIRDRKVEPKPLLLDSIARADVGWHVKTSRSAGSASAGKRQAGQFGRKLGRAMEEHDFFVRLER